MKRDRELMKIGKGEEMEIEKKGESGMERDSEREKNKIKTGKEKERIEKETEGLKRDRERRKIGNRNGKEKEIEKEEKRRQREKENWKPEVLYLNKIFDC